MSVRTNFPLVVEDSLRASLIQAVGTETLPAAGSYRVDDARELILKVDVTAVALGGLLDITLETSRDGNAPWHLLKQYATMSTVGAQPIEPVKEGFETFVRFRSAVTVNSVTYSARVAKKS